MVPRNAVFLGAMQGWHEMGPELSSPLAARGVSVSPQRCCPLSLAATPGPLARGTNEFNWLETSVKIISTHGGRNSERFWVHTCILSENKICAEQTCVKGGVPCTRQSKGSQTQTWAQSAGGELLPWWPIPNWNSSAYKGNQKCKTVMDIKIPTFPK